MAKRSPEINQKFLTITDHGMLGAVPRQIKACEKNKISPIFGCELFINPLQQESSGLKDIQLFAKNLDENQKKQLRVSAHLLAIAYNETGYKNLVRLTSWGWTKGFYNRPRINYEQLLKHKEGLYFTSCCYASEVGKAFDKGGDEAGFAMIEKYIEMVGKDHYFLELMMLDFKKQKPYDAFIIRAHEKYGLPLILTQDCHYCFKEDSKYQRLMLMVQTRRTIQDIEKAMAEDNMQDFFELQDQNLWMKSEEELNEKWEKDYQDVIPYEIFCQAKANTVKICEKAKGVQLDRSLKLPKLPDADEILREEVIKGFRLRGLPQTREYTDRLKEELSLITRKGFSSYFLIQKKMTDEARRICAELLGWGDGSQAVGPGRGCLSPDVPIITTNGVLKSISKIMPGDQVLTRDGSFKEVKTTFAYPVKEDLLSLYVYYGDNRGVSLTKDHKVLVEKGKRVENYENWSESTKSARKSISEPIGDLQWIRADEVSVGDWLYIPIPKLETNIPNVFDMSQFCSAEENLILSEQEVYQDIFNPLTKKLRRRKICKRYIDFNSEIFWIVVGMFAGDGWWNKNNRPTIGFALHSLDTMNLAYLQKFVEELNVDHSVGSHKKKLLKQFYINNKYVLKLFQHLFCRYQSCPETKHVPNIVFTLPENLKWAFLKGYFLSDGHQAENKISFDSKSEELASQIKFLLLSLGVPSSINYCNRIDKRTSKKSWCYKVNTPLTSFLGLDDAKKIYFYRKLEDGFLLRVRKISLKKDVSFVHDFEVDDNHNYATSSFIVHNSAVGSLICYCLQLTQVDPVYEGLLFSRFMSEARGGRNMCLEFKDMDPLSEEECIVY